MAGEHENAGDLCGGARTVPSQASVLASTGRATAAALVFAPVHVLTSPEREAGAIEVVLVGGERVVVYGGASAELVRTVLAAVRPAC